MQPLLALRAALLALAIVAAAWFVRSGRWREWRLLPISLALLAGLALVSRRVGWGELAFIAGLIVVPAILLAPRRR